VVDASRGGAGGHRRRWGWTQGGRASCDVAIDDAGGGMGVFMALMMRVLIVSARRGVLTCHGCRRRWKDFEAL